MPVESISFRVKLVANRSVSLAIICLFDFVNGIDSFNHYARRATFFALFLVVLLLSRRNDWFAHLLHFYNLAHTIIN